MIIYDRRRFVLYTKFLGRADFIGGIDNEALDFGHLETFMQYNGTANGASISASHVVPISNLNSSTISIVSAATCNDTATAMLTTTTTTATTTATSLPESPPDSGSEPPYSPADIRTVPPLGTLTAFHMLQKPDDGLDTATAMISSSSLPVNEVSNRSE